MFSFSKVTLFSFLMAIFAVGATIGLLAGGATHNESLKEAGCWLLVAGALTAMGKAFYESLLFRN